MKQRTPKHKSHAPRKPKPPLKQRRFPSSNLALCGYWTPPVQRVVKRWAPKIGEDWCQSYVAQAFYSIASEFDGVKVDIVPELIAHKPYVVELLGAMSQMWEDTRKPFRMLLDLAASGSAYDLDKPRPPTWAQVRRSIVERYAALNLRRYGEAATPSEAVLAQTARRMRLNDKIGP